MPIPDAEPPDNRPSPHAPDLITTPLLPNLKGTESDDELHAALREREAELRRELKAAKRQQVELETEIARLKSARHKRDRPKS